MILKAENILGGCILTAAFVEAPDRTEGVCVLTMQETELFCVAIDKQMPFEKNDELALLWPKDGAPTVLIQASACVFDRISLKQLAAHLRCREGNTHWQLGGPTP